MGAAVPDGGMALGKDAWRGERDHGAPAWEWEAGVFTIVPGSGNIRTLESFGDCLLHVEFKVVSAAGVPAEEGEDLRLET